MASERTSCHWKPPSMPLRQPPPNQSLQCPRCDSPNTKFCYYNNYSLTQPRYFCKACRRYWTKGGALRSVPIGGGSRKHKRAKTAQLNEPNDSESGGIKFLHGIGGLPFSRLHSPSAGVFNPFLTLGDDHLSSSAACSSAALEAGAISPPLMGINFPLQSALKEGIKEMGHENPHSSFVSSIESLSSINQDMHWKLQQQRLGMLSFLQFGGVNQDMTSVAAGNSFHETQKNRGQPFSFQESDGSKAGNSEGNSRKACVGSESPRGSFFDNSFSAAHGNGCDDNNWNEINIWNDLQHYSALR